MTVPSPRSQSNTINNCLYTTHAITLAETNSLMHEALPVMNIPSHKVWIMRAAIRTGGAGNWGPEGVA